VPVLPGTSRLAASGEVPGGTRSNLAFSTAWTAWDDGVAELDRIILADAQTSGGLLAAVPRATSSRLLAGMETRRIEGAIIGVITGWGTGRVQVTAGRSDLGLD
jgi:selenide,water dikinase